MGSKDGHGAGPDHIEALSEIIRTLNEHYGTSFNDEDKLCIRELEERLAENGALGASLRANSRENARLTFDHVVNDLLQDMVDGHFKFYKKVTDDPLFARGFADILFDRYVDNSERVNAILASVPSDDPMVAAMDRAAGVLAQAGLTVDDLLNSLPRIRDQLARATYGDEFMDALGRERAALLARDTGDSNA